MENRFMDPNSNDSFASLRGFDLQELLVIVENCYINYRMKLGLPKEVTFGVELEYEGLFKFISDYFVFRKLNTWESKRDGSLFTGGEICSPIMVDKDNYWRDLKIICDNLRKRGAITNRFAGGHIHIGTNVLGDNVNAWKTFIELYALYEHVLFRFLYGDKLNGRKGIDRYAPPVASRIRMDMNAIRDAKDYQEVLGVVDLSYDRYFALNLGNVSFYNPSFKDYKNTIEFRAPNASVDAIIWQNNINALVKLLVSSRSDVIDQEFLDYKLSDEDNLRHASFEYDAINLKDVLEFVDLIFDNNLDKVYFLRQYFKSFQNNYNFSHVCKAKKFTR